MADNKLTKNQKIGLAEGTVGGVLVGGGGLLLLAKAAGATAAFGPLGIIAGGIAAGVLIKKALDKKKKVE